MVETMGGTAGGLAGRQERQAGCQAGPAARRVQAGVSPVSAGWSLRQLAPLAPPLRVQALAPTTARAAS